MTCTTVKPIPRWMPFACILLFGACAPVVPKELANARDANQRANTGQTAQLAPSEVHQANDALAAAEAAFEEDEDSYMTRDLAYVAQRKAQFAEATASILAEQSAQEQSANDLQSSQGEATAQTQKKLTSAEAALLASQQGGAITAERLSTEKQARLATEHKLDSTEAALVASKQGGAITAERLSTEKAARIAAEKRASDAQAALAKLAEVKEDARGTVITLSGSVLFASNKSTLLPAARSRVDQVADVLLATGDRSVLVEGYTDSQGSESRNLALSQRRADAVRDQLVKRSYRSDRIRATGLGEARPVADNTSPEGRANNRRVEIIIEREVVAAKP